MESGSESDDEETINQDLQQLTEVIKEDDALLSKSSRISSISVNTGSTSAATEGQDALADVESALVLNKLIAENLVKLQKMLMNRLTECRNRLEEFRKPILPSLDKTESRSKFKYIKCGRPYFRDKLNFPAPDNEDTILMKKSGMYDLSMVSHVSGWTVNDKSQFQAILLSMTRKIRTEEIESEIKQLKRDAKIAKVEDYRERIQNLRQEIDAIKIKSLDEIALPLDREYDWELIANKLDSRHTAKEYRSLWKLFLHPSINKTPWNKAEHTRLQKIAHENNFQDWDKIAEELNTGRTGYQCFVYFRTNASNTVTGQKWTKEEEEYLKRLINFFKEDTYIPWNKVAAAMETRTKVQVYNKYRGMIVKRRGRFLPEEDTVILTCLKKYGKNFTKIAEHLPGRSAKQVQVRCKILDNQSNLSVVWTAEEDKRLIQIVSNSDTAVNYSGIAQHFPGKDRHHIRARYLTLEKWMKRHPYEDISKAPRRAARRLAHGQSTTDIKGAVESLTCRMENEVCKQKSKISKTSSEKEIEDSIITLLVNEEYNEEAERKKDAEDEDEIKKRKGLLDECASHNETGMHRTLILLKAKLDKSKFVGSIFEEKYPGLVACNVPDPSTYRTYSKKVEHFEQAGPSNTNTVDIWGGNTLLCTEYYMPPNYDTITGCKKIMRHVREMMSKLDLVSPSFALLEKNNALVRQQKRLLMVRFCTIFLWPTMLSTFSPSLKSQPSPKKPKKKTTLGSDGLPIFVKPQFKEPQVNETIDLKDRSEEGEDRSITTSIYVGNDDFLYLPTDT